MLKVECTKCNEWVHLPFDTDVKETRCPSCAETIPVTDIYVSSGSFLIARDILAKNIFKYRRLLLEAESEVSDIRRKGGAGKPCEISSKTISAFISNLKELLDGCRNSSRFELKDVIVKYALADNSQTHQAGIVNISLSGVCIDVRGRADMGKLWKEIVIHFREPGTAGHFQLNGKVMWINGALIGVKFEKVEHQDQKMLKDYILEKTS
ncbi:MAG: PilZ domain-containing protein, partial [Deltaproteobacteria bacterium]|nr:PilZ domain-containing protein [Deltaproteobacteria bacterium]